jgi:uncharacterized protein (TIRG00374 family)
MKRRLLQMMKVVISVGLITFLVWKISPGMLVPHLRNMNIPVLLGAVAVFFVSSCLGSLQWHLLLRAGGISLTPAKTFRLYFVGLFFNNFFPTNVGGDAVKIFDVTRSGNDPHQVFAVTLLDRIIGISGLCILALAASLLLARSRPVYNLWIYILVFVGCIAPVLLLTLNKRLSRAVRMFFGRLNVWRLGERFDLVFSHLGSFREFRALMLHVLLLALVVQFLRVATHVLVGRALGAELTVGTFLSFYVFIPLLGLVMVLPISLNGLGVREGTGILLFTTVGFSREQALLLEFITYVVMVAVSLIGGIFFLRRHLGRG